MQEHHVPMQRPLSSLGQQAGHGFAGVHRIEQESLGPGDKPNGVNHLRGGNSVTGADETIVQQHAAPLGRPRFAEEPRSVR